jgi:penicillin amidase
MVVRPFPRSSLRFALCAVIGLCAAACRPSAPAPTAPKSLADLARESLSPIDGTLRLKGLREEVRVLRDEWGVPHIFASNTDDLFFAQGFVIAQDRLWQMEIWRRQGEGRTAEVLGAGALPHDRLVRLLKFRGRYDDAEWTSYHPEGKRIFEAYAAGVNAFIASAGDRLPVEFRLVGLRPELWTAEHLLLRARVSEAVSDARAELRLARSVAAFGAAKASANNPTVPADSLKVPDGVDYALIGEDVLKALDGDMYGNLPKPELLPEFRALPGARASLDMGVPELSPGSNNWAIAGSRSATGKAIMVDDPHRQVTNPAHRYVIHLVAPGWNVAGATEAPLPGVIRGHNGRVAWGRTATDTDQGDVYIETVNPDNPNEVLFDGKWEPMTRISESIAVRDEAPRPIELKFTRHGPVFHEDREHHLAYALKSHLQQPGTAEYIGGLRMDQAGGAKDCLETGYFMPTPPTNLVCADADGHIAFRIAVFAPSRKGWNGRLPVPGTGKYEWEPGRRRDLPSEYDPARGYIATANNPTQPPGFAPPYAYVAPGGDYRRYERIREMIESHPGRFTIDEMLVMLRDSLNLEARRDIPSYRGWSASDPVVEKARAMVASWNGVLDRESTAAAIYMSATPRSGSPEELTTGLKNAVARLTETQGTDWAAWRWGRMNRSEFPHPVASAFDVAAVERQGGGGTVNAVGAVYRLVTDFADPDNSRVAIGPGMSGQPESPFYSNLLGLWGRNEFFTLLFRTDTIDVRARHRLVLSPAN